MDSEQIQELAQLYATEGLEGEQHAAFEAWKGQASAAEKAEFAAVVDAIAMASLATLAREVAPSGGKAGLMKAIACEEAAGGAGRHLKEAPVELPGGFTFLSREEGEWVSLPVPGVRVKELSAKAEDGMTVFLLEMAAGSRLPTHHHHGAEMAYVLEGELVTEGRTLRAGDFMRAGTHSDHSPAHSPGGCRALLITAAENYPRRTVGVMRRLQDVYRACRDLVAGG